MFTTVSAADMRTAQTITLATFALWLGVGLVPAMRPYARLIRLAVLALYLLGATGFVLYVMES